MKLHYKSFITHKRGETDEDIQDSIAVNAERGRFALSDGVTNSFLPHILSDILTRLFVEEGEVGQFPPSSLPDIFIKARNHYLDSLNEDIRILQEMVEEEFRYSAATFVGISVKEFKITWQILGDSCLFILHQNGQLSCICSMNVTTTPEGCLQVDFNNYPRQIRSSGEIVGEWIKGEQKACPGWIVLASDAMSQWIIQQHNEGNNPISLLWALKDNQEFENFVDQECREVRLKSDDESVILIKISTNDSIKGKSESSKSTKSLKSLKFKKQGRAKKLYKHGNLKMRKRYGFYKKHNKNI